MQRVQKVQLQKYATVFFFKLPIPLCVYIPLFSIYTDKHNISLLPDFIIVLWHVSIVQGDHHQVRSLSKSSNSQPETST
jgi:hypothetical protein